MAVPQEAFSSFRHGKVIIVKRLIMTLIFYELPSYYFVIKLVHASQTEGLD